MGRTGFGFQRRTRRFSEAGDFLCVIDHEGNMKYVKIVKDEPLGYQPILMAGLVAGVNGGGVLCGYNAYMVMGEGTNAIGANSSSGLIPLPYLEPARQNRIFEAIPYVYAVPGNATGILSGIQLPPEASEKDRLLIANLANLAPAAPILAYPPTALPVNAYFLWEHPVGSRRGGSDLTTALLNVGVIANINRGGVNSGRIPLPLMHQDVSIFGGFDLTFWCIYGTYPSIGIENRSKGRNMGGDGAGVCPANTTDDEYNYYVGFMGRKYEVIDPTKKEIDDLKERKLEFRSAVVGGMPQATTKA
jgi:hypothetical protein|tara:strand:+ start:548 stop:1456 length:909 start_codon:yes stop_codon:yes gene_type:complete